MIFTRANFIALVESAEGTPYLYGGIDPFHGGADCSGLVYWAGLQCGVTLPRSTQAEWAGLQCVTDPSLAGSQPGDLVEFAVPSDGGQAPQHVGIIVSAGTMVDDPETGQVVSVQQIPNTPGIWPIGYCRLPFAVPAPPPPLVPTFLEVLGMPSPVSDPGFAVRFLYRFALHREADQSGYDANVAWLNAGGPIDTVLANLQDSPEGQEVLAGRLRPGV